MHITPLKRSVLAVAVALATVPAAAADFEIGGLRGQFDSSLSIGASWAMSDAASKLIGAENGGTGFSTSGDDGRQNFKKGETYSKIFKGVHDLELSYGDTRAFVRGKY